MKHRNKLPREMVDKPLLEVFKLRLGGGSGQPDLVQDVPAHCRGVGLGHL